MFDLKVLSNKMKYFGYHVLNGISKIVDAFIDVKSHRATAVGVVSVCIWQLFLLVLLPFSPQLIIIASAAGYSVLAWIGYTKDLKEIPDVKSITNEMMIVFGELKTKLVESTGKNDAETDEK